MRGCVAHRHDQIACRDQGGKRVDVPGIIDLPDSFDCNSKLLLGERAFCVCVAILQIDSH